MDHELARKNSLVYWAGRHLTNAAIKGFYNVEYRDEHNLGALKSSPFILLPKHNHFLDVMVEGNMVADVLDRQAYYIMKEELPDFLRVVGGIKVDRPQKRITLEQARGDPELAKRRLEQRSELKESGLRNDAVYECLAGVYNSGEIGIVHVEGKRNYKKEGVIKEGVITRLVNLATQEDPVFVPADMEYEDVRKFRSKIIVTVGRPIQTRDRAKLVEHLLDNIDLLRGE